MSSDPDALLAAVEDMARQTLEDIEDVLPEVLMLVGALDYDAGRPLALFEPLDREMFRVAEGFLNGDHVRVIWHRQSSYAMRPDAEAFSVAVALLALADDNLLHLVDAIPVFTRWRDGFFLQQNRA